MIGLNPRDHSLKFLHWFVCNTTEECIQTIDRIHQMLVVFDEHGNNMVNRMLDVGKIIF